MTPASILRFAFRSPNQTMNTRKRFLTALASFSLATLLSLSAVHAVTIADFVNDYPTVNGAGPQFDGTETPGPGWDYMWNPVVDGMGTATNYQSLVPNTVNSGGSVDDEGLFTNIGDIAFNATGQGNFRYGRIGIGSSHPGSTQHNRTIYAYTIQSGEAGTVSITGSSLLMNNTGSNGIDLDVYVNDSLISALSIDGFNTTGTAVAGAFDGPLGTLNVGDTVYVTIGNNGSSANDAFVIDFSLESLLANDNEPPTPDPMTWASVPAAVNDSSITMTATTADDPAGVEYYFTCTSGTGNDSGWQSSPTYVDTGLSPSTTYSYTVKARDAIGLYETAASDAESATTDAPDTAKPTPDPMSFAIAPAATGPYSITMTATTANDASGVEYYFDETSGNPGGTDSGWQDSPEYTDDGLDAETEYTYTVTARDKSAAGNTTAPSDPASATTDNIGTILLGGFDGSNAVDAPIQHPIAVGNISMSLSTTLDPSGLNPGNYMQSSSPLWGTTDLDPDAQDNGIHNAVLGKNGPYDLMITVTNTSSDKDVTLEKLHWRSKRDLTTSDTHATIKYISGSLTDSLGTSTEFYLGGLGGIGHDFTLADMMTDYVLAPGETATFSWFIEEAGAQIRWDNIAISGTFSDSDYIGWSSLQGWTVGGPGTSGNEDYDLDGLTNDEERIYGLDPMDPSSRNRFAVPLDPAAGTFSYTRRSQGITGLNYPVWFSIDLVNWYRDIHATETPGASVDDIETVAVQINPALLNEPRLFLRVEAEPPLTLPAPELINIVGNNTTITMNFTEDLYQLAAEDPANFTVELDGGGTVAVAHASLSENNRTVTLTLGSTLALASTYNVTLSNQSGVTGVPLTGGNTTQFQTWDDDPNGVKVFILAGQSNMVGYGREGSSVDVNGSLRYLANNNASYPEYDYTTMLDTPGDPANSTWTSRSDVQVWWRANTSGNATLGTTNIRKGDLTVGFGKDDTMIGPEYAFGQILGDFYPSNDVLIIKTAWGGKALASEFRPPSAVADRGGEVGLYYQAIIDQVRQVLDNLDTEFPQWSGQGYQIVGIGWHQGYNDKVSPEFSAEYKDNLPDLISDLRLEFGKPALPFTIASSGMTAAAVEAFPYSGYSPVEQAQLWVAGVTQPAEVQSTDTRPFWEDKEASPMDQGYHWNQNARSYFRIGKALGDDMVNLLTP
jgi:hypothetical protein